MYRTVATAAMLAVALSGCAPAAPAEPSMAVNQVFPGVITLPNGFWPEGIAFGTGSTFYVSSLATGAIFRGDARTGAGDLLVPQVDGGTVGLHYDGTSGRLFAAGGISGQAHVFDASSGALLATYQLGEPGTSLVNDVVVTRTAAYFTDSFQPVLYRVPLAPGGGLPEPADVQVLPLGGEYVHVEDALIANANGIAATADGAWLIIVNTETGTLYRVDARSGEARTIAIPGEPVSGDGILLEGRTLYVVEGHLDRIAVIRLSPDMASGTVQRHLTDPDLRFPSTIAPFGGALYAVNARFDVAPDPTVEYEVVRIAK